MNVILTLTAFTWRSRLQSSASFAFAGISLIPAFIAFMSMKYGEPIDNDLSLLREVVVPMNVYFTLPFITLFLTLPTISSLYEKGAIAYLFTRPVSRLKCIIGLFVGSFTSALPFLVISAISPAIVCALYAGNEVDSLGTFAIMHSLLLLIALLPYCALCLLLSIWSKKPLLWASFFLFFWGSIIGSLPGDAKMFSLHHYVMGLAKSMCDIDKVAAGLIPPSAEPPADWLSVVVLLSVSAIFIYIANLSSKGRDVI
ncbi:MAG: ABC transporter permease subunit [Planctomycetota bacterium]|jgi:ABC-type transport system involved in multi-copper enzyme maturation permease subunit|nr:ABC transporter permease subunit [Planctomycetota bacterium]